MLIKIFLKNNVINQYCICSSNLFFFRTLLIVCILDICIFFLFYPTILGYPDIDPPPYPGRTADENPTKESTIVNPSAPAYSTENYPNTNYN